MIAFLGEHHGALWTLLALVAVGQYLVRCALWPFARCWACKGKTQKFDPMSRRKAWRDCRVCKGSGRRLRIGRRAWAYFSKSRRKAKI